MARGRVRKLRWHQGGKGGIPRTHRARQAERRLVRGRGRVRVRVRVRCWGQGSVYGWFWDRGREGWFRVRSKVGVGVWVGVGVSVRVRACWPRAVQPLLRIAVVVSALGPGESWLGLGWG